MDTAIKNILRIALVLWMAVTGYTVCSIRARLEVHLDDRIIYVYSDPKPQYYVDFTADKVVIDGEGIKIK